MHQNNAPVPAGNNRSAVRTFAWVGAAALLTLAGCGNKNAGPAAGAGGGMPPPEVGVIAVAPRTVPLAAELPGRVEAGRTAQVRARVTGIVLKRLFTEGSDVKAGQVLFQIDPAPYRAALDSARAAQAKAEANLAQASALFERYKPLREANAISQQDFVNAQAAQAQAQADVSSAKAAVESAELNLGYATVTAPIGGRIGRALVTEGALVTQAEATQLALIQQLSPVYINFTQSASDLAQLRRRFTAGKAEALGKSVPVHVLLDDGTELHQTGKLLFSDVSVDPTSGQVTLRAEVPNADGQLLPGMYVRGRIAQAQIDGAMLVPQQAVTRTPQGDTVLVVGEDGKPAPRPVKVSGADGGNWVVTGGLKAGEQVIVDGFQKMRPGAPVKPVPWSGAGSAPAQAPSGAAPAASAAGSAPMASASAASR